MCLDWSHDGNLLAAGNVDGLVQFYHPTNLNDPTIIHKTILKTTGSMTQHEPP